MSHRGVLPFRRLIGLRQCACSLRLAAPELLSAETRWVSDSMDEGTATETCSSTCSSNASSLSCALICTAGWVIAGRRDERDATEAAQARAAPRESQRLKPIASRR